MTKKQATAPAECLKMNIEMDNNGIIIRNPEHQADLTVNCASNSTEKP